MQDKFIVPSLSNDKKKLTLIILILIKLNILGLQSYPEWPSSFYDKIIFISSAYWISWCQKIIFFGSSKTCYMSTKLHSSLISLYSASWREMNLIDYAWSVEKSYLKNWDWFLDLRTASKKSPSFVFYFIIGQLLKLL